MYRRCTSQMFKPRYSSYVTAQVVSRSISNPMLAIKSYPDSDIKKVRTGEKDVPKVDWYKLSLNFIQMLVNQIFMLQFRLECFHSSMVG
jgi:hypothetical protein